MIKNHKPLKKDIVFIHIPKNAGTSVKKSIKEQIFITEHNVDFEYIFQQKIKQLIVVRNPLERFCSSVNFHIKNENSYVLQNINKYEYTSFLINNGFVTPNDWASALRDKKHKYHEPVSRIIIGPRAGRYFDFVDNSKISMPWHFAPQHIWIRQPDYVILFENLHQEFHRFCQFHFNIKPKLCYENQSTPNSYLETRNARFISKIFFLDEYYYSKFASKEPHERLCAGIRHEHF